MKMLPPKELDVVKLKYVEKKAGLTYLVLRRQVEFWLESFQTTGTVPMDLSTPAPTDVSKFTEEQLEGALCVLRKKGGKDKKGKKCKRGKKGGKGKNCEQAEVPRKIAGNCWNCDKSGHASQDCRQPRHAGLKSLSGDEDDDDESSSDGEITGVAGLSIGCLDVCTNLVDISWKVPLFNDLYNVSREAACHPSDEAGESRNTSSPIDDNS